MKTVRYLMTEKPVFVPVWMQSLTAGSGEYKRSNRDKPTPSGNALVAKDRKGRACSSDMGPFF